MSEWQGVMCGTSEIIYGAVKACTFQIYTSIRCCYHCYLGCFPSSLAPWIADVYLGCWMGDLPECLGTATNLHKILGILTWAHMGSGSDIGSSQAHRIDLL